MSTFKLFSELSREVADTLNLQQGYTAKYIVKDTKFAREHDAEYL